MEGSKDKRGVVRGRCFMCDCVAYASTDGLLCTACRHPPMKHAKIDYCQSHHHEVGAYHGNLTSVSTPRQLPRKI